MMGTKWGFSDVKWLKTMESDSLLFSSLSGDLQTDPYAFFFSIPRFLTF
jgi:hypothetical protein